MQNVPGYPSENDVVTPTALVALNGDEFEVESISVSRELSSSLPDQVTSASGMNSATGDVSWVIGEDVQRRSAHPWDGNAFPPKPSDDVVVYMGYAGVEGYGDVMVRQLTGMVDSSQGSIASGDVTSNLVDPIDKLNRPVSFPAIMNIMPPRDEGADFTRVGLQSTYITDRVLRECDFYTTPKLTSGCVFSAPLMGSAWPEVGDVIQAGQDGETGLSPNFNTTAWGIAPSSCGLTYEPDLSKAGGDGRLNRPLQITLKAHSETGSSGDSFVRAYWGSTFISLLVWSDRIVVAYLNDGSSSTELCRFSASEVADADLFTLRVESDGDVTLLANNGRSVTGSASIPSVVSDDAMDRVRVHVSHETGVRIGGVQVNFGSTSINNANQNAYLTPSAIIRVLRAFPRVEDRNALDLLKEQAEAECSSMWIDEHGNFRWVNRVILTEAPVSATLTALDDVIDIGWESNASGVRSKVVIKSQEATTSISRLSNRLAWQGRGTSIEIGDVFQEIVSPPANTDWVDVDEDVKQLPGRGLAPVNWEHDFNRGRGTWVGGIETEDGASWWAGTGNPDFAVDMNKIADSVYKVTANAGIPRSERTVELRTPNEDADTVIWPSKRNMDLPVIRAKAIIEWTDLHTTGIHPGPENSAVLEHDVGPWVQDEGALQELANWLSAQVSTPQPVLRDLSVIPDFRRQLGDIVWIEDPVNMRIQMAVLITSIATSVSAGNATQTIGGRILQVEGYGATNAQLDIHAGGYTNEAFDALWSDATNADLDSNPLGKG